MRPCNHKQLVDEDFHTDPWPHHLVMKFTLLGGKYALLATPLHAAGISA